MNQDKPRIGVYVCMCGSNIAGTVDVPAVTEAAARLKNVVIARYNKYTCAGPGQEGIKQDIREYNLNRVVVAACSPRMHERTWRAMLAEAGLNPYLLEVANLREHCSWAHPAEPMTTQKAIDLVAAAVERVAWHTPLFPQRVPVTKAAMVVGGGVAGIQAALDIARAGVPVYLVEREPSIGGHMAQLDKTFPTLDCSACILTPKMVDAGGHANITLLTYSEVEKVEGYIGNFTVTVRRKARYVDVDTCTGCGDCAKVCPIQVPSEFEQGLMQRTAIYRPFAQAVPNAFVIDKRGVAPCKNACPAGIHVQGYVALIAEGRFREAYDLILERMPFPGVCGRVCHHPCEEACRRGEKDHPVAIEYLKRFAADWVAAHPESEPPQLAEGEERPLVGRKVAIVGAGPAGLTVARDLALQGAACDIFEALPVAGGMMTVGIPRYRLPMDILQRDIDGIVAMPGVNLYLNTAVRLQGDGEGDGPSLASLRRDYDAVFLGLGAHKSIRLGVPGEELEGVLHGASYLRQLNLAQLGVEGVEMPTVGERVVVIGGGNVAIDSAMTARRIGGREVTILYRRTRAEMPANDWEVEEAEEEGIRFHFLATPVEMIGQDGRLTAIRCQRMRLGEPDESGRRRPVPIEGDVFELPVDTVIVAIGQRLEGEIADVERTRRGWIVTDPLTLQTNLPGVFAGGDAVSGPASVVEAVGAGHRAAESIRRYLQGEELALGRRVGPVDTSEIDYYDPQEWSPAPRFKMPRLPVAGRDGFDEVYLGMSEEEAVAEAGRCLSCGVCSECMACVQACGMKCIHHDMEDELVELEVGAIILATGFEVWDPSPMLEYGYGVYPEVYTGLEIERLSNASGPTGGEIVMRDGRPPRRVAIIHCVGSRDEHYNSYCSRICCMYSLKLAHLIREKTHAEVFEFYMDIRAFGKGYEEFYERVQHEGVVFVRGRGAQVLPTADGKRLVVRAEDTELGCQVELPVDMVVLATAVVPARGAAELAQTLHVTRGTEGFFLEAHPKLRPVESNTDGIYLAGACQAPRDIPDTVAHASAAASQALGLLSQKYVEVVPTVAEVRTLHCVGCGLCVEVCPYGAPSLVESRGRLVAEVNEALCKGCGLCVAACRGKAISLRGFTDTQVLTQLETLLQLEWA